MKKANTELTPRQKAEIDALKAMPDEKIDTSDIPEVVDWSNAKRGMFHHLKEGLPPPPRTGASHKGNKRQSISSKATARSQSMPSSD